MIDLPPPDPVLEITIASHGMSKGLSQSDGPQLIVRPQLKLGDVFAGAQWKNITSPVAGGEAAMFVGYGREVAKFQLSLQAGLKFQTGVNEPTDDKAWEFTGAVSRKVGKVTLKGSAVYSPDDLGGTRRSLYLEAGPTIDISKQWRILANVGRRNRLGGLDYTSWNAGVSTTMVPRVTLDLRWYDTNRHEAGDAFKGRAVAIAKMVF